MKVILTSMFVDDQNKALAFYTEKLAAFDNTYGNFIRIMEAK